MVRLPARARGFLHIGHTGCGAQTTSQPKGMGGEVKRQEREADNSRPSSAEVSVWSYTSTSAAACLDGVMLNEAQEQLCFTVSNSLLEKLAT